MFKNWFKTHFYITGRTMRRRSPTPIAALTSRGHGQATNKARFAVRYRAGLYSLNVAISLDAALARTYDRPELD